MNVNVEMYHATNGAQHVDMREVLNRIFQDGVTDVKTVVEIGCGSGNVTKMVAETLPFEKMYAFDIDSDMVDLARKVNEGNTSIEFFVQDVSVPWEELNSTLRDLEGKVDLIWSNRVLHWVKDDLRPLAARNIVRLLRPGGRTYINTTLTCDINETLPSEEKAENEKLMKIPSKDTQLEWWTKYFTDAGLSPLTVEYFDKIWDYGTPEIYQTVGNYFHFWKRYIPAKIPVEQHDEIIEKFKGLFLRSYCSARGQPPLESIDGVTVSHYGQFRIIGTKPN